jgi:hypothetical protein
MIIKIFYLHKFIKVPAKEKIIISLNKLKEVNKIPDFNLTPMKNNLDYKNEHILSVLMIKFY